MKPAIYSLSSLLLIMLSAMIYSCRSIPQLQSGTDLVVESSYLQKEFPGEEHLPIKDYLNITFKSFDTDAYQIDSLYYMDKIYYIKNTKPNYKIWIASGSKKIDPKFMSNQNDVTMVFYHKQNLPLYMKIEGFQRKDPIYLP